MLPYLVLSPQQWANNFGKVFRGGIPIISPIPLSPSLIAVG